MWYVVGIGFWKFSATLLMACMEINLVRSTTSIMGLGLGGRASYRGSVARGLFRFSFYLRFKGERDGNWWDDVLEIGPEKWNIRLCLFYHYHVLAWFQSSTLNALVVVSTCHTKVQIRCQNVKCEPNPKSTCLLVAFLHVECMHM